MEVPEVWLAFGNHIYADWLTDNPDIMKGFRWIFDQFSPEQRQELHRFLSDILSRKPSVSELSDLWYLSKAKLLVVEEDIPTFFELLMIELESSIKANQ